MSTSSSTQETSTAKVIAWYRRPTLWVAVVALLLGIGYAVLMYLNLQGKEEAHRQLTLSIEQEKKAADAARVELRNMPESLPLLKEQLQGAQEQLAQMQKNLEQEQNELNSLKQNEVVKEYIEKAPQVKELTKKTQELTSRLQSKLQKYQELVKKNRE